MNAYGYIRVSTEMQVDGYSLEAQLNSIKKYCEMLNYNLINIYSDAGISGKNDDRDEFQQMKTDIVSNKDNIKYVIAFKLSRIGRNTKNVLEFVEFLEDYEINLICIEDNINTENQNSKFFISVMASMAEMERENINTQTMAGRIQKAKNGLWNGGQAPYGYKIIDNSGILKINDEEAEIVKLIFDKYINTSMGYNGVSNYLNEIAIKRTPRNNTKKDYWTPDAVLNILNNPVYCGLIAYGRTKTEKVKGEKNKYRRVEKKEFNTYKGQHEAIISTDTFENAKIKINSNITRRMKKHDLEHEHLLSGILKCPVCGHGMYGNVNRKKKPDGTYYASYFYYSCDYSKKRHNHICSFKAQIEQDKINELVEIDLLSVIGDNTSTEALYKRLNKEALSEEEKTAKELASLNSRLSKLNNKKNNINNLIIEIDLDDPFYKQKIQDFNEKLNQIYLDIDNINLQINAKKPPKFRQKNYDINEVCNMVNKIGEIYENLTMKQKKALFNALIDSVEIFEQSEFEDMDDQGNIYKYQDSSRIKKINYKLPILEELYSWDKLTTDETVCLLSKKP